jgi:hypothetical protein
VINGDHRILHQGDRVAIRGQAMIHLYRQDLDGVPGAVETLCGKLAYTAWPAPDSQDCRKCLAVATATAEAAAVSHR